MDLHITDKAAIPYNNRERGLDPHNFSPYADYWFNLIILPYLLPAKHGILLTTQEEVSIPMFFSGLIGMRSTWARLGLLTPPTVADPGFEGTLTLELYNASPNSIWIKPQDSIWHILLVSTPFEPKYNGSYQHQVGLTLPKQLP